MCVLDETVTDIAECRMKVAKCRKVAYATRSLFNANDLQLGRARVLFEILFCCMSVIQ